MRVFSILRIAPLVLVASSLLAAPANVQVDTKTHAVSITDGSTVIDAKAVTLTLGGFTIYDGAGVKTIVTGSASGAMFGAAGNKISFLGATPIIRPSATTDLRSALINLGLYTTGGATPLNLNGGAFTSGTISGTNETLSGTLGVTGATTFAGTSYWSVTNSTQPNALISFVGPGNDAGSVNGYFMTATWNAVAAQKGYTLAVENIVPANAPAFGAAAALYGGLLNYRADTDGAGIIGVINNVTGISPVGAAMWGIVRGPNASDGPVDGIRSTSETDGSEHPQYGVIVNNSTANNAFKFGFIVAGSVDFGFCVGLGSNSATEVVPTYPFAYKRKTDAQIRFNVNNTGIVTGSKLSVLDSDVWGVPWYLASESAGNDLAGTSRTVGLLKISYGGEEVLNIIPAALGGPSIALAGNDSGLELGLGSKIYRDSADGSLHLFSQSGTTKVTGALTATGGISAGSLTTAGNISGANFTATGSVSATTITATGAVSGSNTCKAWVNFSDNGTVTVNKSFNVTGVTRNGAGDYTINFTNPMADANYAATISGKLTGGVVFLGMEQMDTATRSTSALRIYTLNSSLTATNAVGCSVVIFD